MSFGPCNDHPETPEHAFLQRDRLLILLVFLIAIGFIDPAVHRFASQVFLGGVNTLRASSAYLPPETESSYSFITCGNSGVTVARNREEGDDVQQRRGVIYGSAVQLKYRWGIMAQNGVECSILHCIITNIFFFSSQINPTLDADWLARKSVYSTSP